MKCATEELRKLWQDEQHHPVTYNHYFTDNIQEYREQMDMDRFLAGLQQRVQVNMTEQACAEALSGLRAYYKV
jgi:hypothetical protein